MTKLYWLIWARVITHPAHLQFTDKEPEVKGSSVDDLWPSCSF